MTYRAVSLFSGAGGLDVGLEATGKFDFLGCLEYDSDFCDTLRKNRDAGRFGSPELQVLEADLSTFTPAEAMSQLGLKKGELPLLAGGPPCQSFSTAGRRQSVEDPRGELLWRYLDYIVEMRPKVFMMENVRGLLSAALRHRRIVDRPPHGPPLSPDEMPGSVVEMWMRDLVARTDGEYRVDCFEVNAVNYGAPQLRERALLIGNRLGHVLDFPAPTHFPQEHVEAGEAERPFATLRDAIGNLDEAERIVLDFSPRKKRYLSMVPSGANWRALPEEIQQESMGRAWHAKGGRSGWWRRLSWDVPSPTLVTLPNHASTSMCHPVEIRALSIGEYAAIQEFPTDWEFAGTLQKQYQQAGNAVPTRLGTVAGEVIAGALASRKRRVNDAPTFRRVYVNSHVRTRKWYKAGETFIWAAGEPGPRYYS